MTSLIVFDLDGVLVDSKTIHFDALNDALRALSPDYIITKEEQENIYEGLPTKAKLSLLNKYKGLPEESFDSVWRLKQEITSIMFSNIPEDKETTRELSRFCIKPKFQKKNFGSWFISRAIKMLDSKYSKIISYCDTTFNHTGALYKSLNFELDSIIKPDYWYASDDGWIMHKKTLYNHAVKMQMTESEFAEKHNYMKIHGKEKLKFVYSC
jgi:hypothetical protein